MEASVQKARVLYVDDIKANLMLFEASFDSEYEVLLAESGKEALKVLEKHEVHVIVSDQNMPGMTGNELLEIVTKEYPDVMRFMITAYTDYETVVEAINKGHLYGFFNKPYNIEDVKISIDKSLEVRNLRISNREMILKLERANEALKGIDKSKTGFLSALTEEIRSPINKIMTALHMIKDKSDSSEISELLTLLDTSVSRLEGFSEAAQQLVRLSDDGFALELAELSFQELAEVAIIESQNKVTEADLSLQLDAAPELRIHGEFDLLLESATSMIAYVVRNSNKGAELKLFTRAEPDSVALCLSSSDSSLDEEEIVDLNAYFDPDGEGDSLEKSLEMVLVSEIVRVHSGYVSFMHSESGQCEFSLVFPFQ